MTSRLGTGKPLTFFYSVYKEKTSSYTERKRSKRSLVVQCWNFLKNLWVLGTGNRVVVPGRQATQSGGIGSLESVLGLLKSLKILALDKTLIITVSRIVQVSADGSWGRGRILEWESYCVCVRAGIIFSVYNSTANSFPFRYSQKRFSQVSLQIEFKQNYMFCLEL